MADRSLASFNPGNKGFTLIEVLIALGIFAIGFLAVASLQISANLGGRKAIEATQASAMASDVMEELMISPFDDENLDPTKNPHLRSDGKYEIEWEVADSDLNADGDSDAKMIELSVNWKSLLSNGVQRNLKIIFIKHDL